MKAIFQNSKIFLEFKFDWNIIDALKATSICAYNPSNKKWSCPDTPATRNIISKAFPGLIESPKIDQKIEINNLLMQHQKQGVETALERFKHCFWYDTGTGKTLMSLEIIRQLKVKTLIVTPLSIIKNAWLEDAAKFYPDMSILNFWELNKKHDHEIKKALQSFKFGIINYELFRIYAKKYGWNNIDCLILDESAKIKNPSAQVTKEIIKLSDTVKYLFSLTATPAPNSLMDYWPQLRIVAPNLAGKSFYKWKIANFAQSGYGGFKWIIKDKKTEEKILDQVAAMSSSVRKEDVLDLPERTFRIRSIQLNTEERKIYKEMSKNLFVALSEDKNISAANAAVKIGKLRQITAGFLIDSESKEISDFGQSKLNELIDLLEEIGKKQVLIWTQYQYESLKIGAKFYELGITYGICNGTISQKKQDEAIEGFKSGAIQYLLAHPASIGHGITLVNCSYSVYFSRSYSYQEQYQSQDRIYRYGQKNACSYYFIDAENSIDEIIREAVNDKKELNQVFINYFQNSKINA